MRGRRAGSEAAGRLRAAVEHVVDEVNQIGDVDRFDTVTVYIRLFEALWIESGIEHIVHEVDKVGYINQLGLIVVNVARQQLVYVSNPSMTLTSNSARSPENQGRRSVRPEV